MKLNVRLANANPGDIRATPLDMRCMAQKVAVDIANLMRLHGIETITARSTQVGACTVLDKVYTPVGEPPGTYLQIREKVVSLLAEYMALFGITSIAMLLTEDDIHTIEAHWDEIVTTSIKADAKQEVQ
jgi:hypothetical protein